jgi:MFS family permease
LERGDNMGSILGKMKSTLNPYKGLSKQIYIIFISRVINAAGAFIFPLMALILTKKLGITKSNTGLIISVAGLLFMISSVIAGKLSDIFGRKKLVIIFSTLSACNFLIVAIIGVSINIIPFILFAGMLANMSWPVQGAMITDMTVPENRKATFSLFYMGMNIGFAIAPIVGGILFEKYLRILFIGDAVTTLISTLLIFIFIEETFSKTKEKLDDKRELEKGVEGSIISVLFSRPLLVYFALIIMGYNFVYAQWSFLYPIHLEQIFVNKGAVIYGRLMGINAIMVIILTPLLTAITSRFKDLKVIFFGGILYTIGFGILGFVDTIYAFSVSVFIFTLGEIIISINLMPFIANHTPASHRGRMNSIIPMIMAIGQTIGPLIMGRFVTSNSINYGWRLAGFVMIIFTFLMLLLNKLNLER